MEKTATLILNKSGNGCELIEAFAGGEPKRRNYQIPELWSVDELQFEQAVTARKNELAEEGFAVIVI